MKSTISTLNLKGGSGKTTLIINLATRLSRYGRAIIFDLDPQESAYTWARHAKASERKQFDLYRDVYPVKLKGKHLASKIKEEIDEIIKKEKASIVLIDTPPALDDPALVAALLSDLVLVPITPSPLDVWAAQKAIEAAKEAQRARMDGRPGIIMVPMRLIKGTLIAKDLPDILATWEGMVSPPIHQRVAIAESALAGQTIDQYAPKSMGSLEFDELSKYVYTQINKLK